MRVEEHIDTCAACRELVSALVMAQTGEDSVDPGADDDDRSALLAPSAPASLTGAEVPPVGGVLPPGTRIGAFELERPLDAGGMGLVYTAHDTRLDRKVAIKGVRDSRGRSDQLLQEARTMAQLSHPNIVAVYEVIDAHDQVFLAMELVVGQSVRQWLDAAPRGWKAIVDVFAAAGAGLAAAHAAGIVHGDIKPANLLYGDDGRVRVTDFGLSSGRGEPGEATVPGRGPRGTPAYMAPEQRLGRPVDALGDQYSFCVSLHEALFGALPAAPPARQLRIPRALRRLLLRGMATEPEARFPSMQALLRALRATRSNRDRWIAAAVLVAAVVAAVAFGTAEHRVQARMCAASAPQLVNPWTAELRYMVHQSFLATELPYAPQIVQRVEGGLDAWARAFEQAREDLCDTGWLRKPPPPEEFAARLQCLQDTAEQAAAVVHVLRDTVDATTVQNAINAIAELAPAARCSQPRPTARASIAVLSPARTQLGPDLARIHALLVAGKGRSTLPMSQELVRKAEATGDPNTLATALVSLGSSQLHSADHKAATASLLRALRLAESIPNDMLRTMAWVNLVENEYRQGHYEQVVFLQHAALGAAERLGDVFMMTELQLLVGGAQSQLGRLEEAQVLFEQAVTARRKIYGVKDSRVASALTAVGNAFAMQGDLARGIPAHVEAAQIAEAALGPSHPNVGTMYGNLGSDYLYGGEPARAVRELTHALQILDVGPGTRNSSTLMVLTDLGLAQLEAGQPEAALTTFERACALWAQASPKHPSRGQALLGRYRALRALGRPAAVADLEQALELAQYLPPFMRAAIEHELSRALGGARAAELLRAAIAGLSTSTLPLVTRELAEAKAELASLPATPTPPAGPAPTPARSDAR